MADQMGVATEVMTPVMGPERPEQLQTSIKGFFSSPEAQKFFGIQTDQKGSPTHTMGMELKKIKGKENIPWLVWASQTANFIGNPRVPMESVDPMTIFNCLEAATYLNDTNYILRQQANDLGNKVERSVEITHEGITYTPTTWKNFIISETRPQKSRVDQYRADLQTQQRLIKEGARARFVTPREQASKQSESLLEISSVSDTYFKAEYTKAISNFKADHSHPEEISRSLGLFFAEKVLAPDSNSPVVNLQRTAAKLVQYYSAFSQDGGKNKEMGQFLQTSISRLHREAIQAGVTNNPEANLQNLCADIGLSFMESSYQDIKGKTLEPAELQALKELKIDPTSLAFQDMYLSKNRGANPLQELRDQAVSRLSETDFPYEQKQAATSAINKLFEPDVFRRMQSLLFSDERTTWLDWNTSLDKINPGFTKKILPTALSFLRFPFKSKQNAMSLLFILSMLLPQLLGSLLKSEDGSGQQAQYH